LSKFGHLIEGTDGADDVRATVSEFRARDRTECLSESGHLIKGFQTARTSTVRAAECLSEFGHLKNGCRRDAYLDRMGGRSSSFIFNFLKRVQTGRVIGPGTTRPAYEVRATTAHTARDRQTIHR